MEAEMETETMGKTLLTGFAPCVLLSKHPGPPSRDGTTWDHPHQSLSKTIDIPTQMPTDMPILERDFFN